MSSLLSSREFDEFFEDVSGFPPFPWQRRLHQEVMGGTWPELMDLPTGVGKTSVLLIALFALASEPDTHQRRIALVVDRRIIVDQVDEFARAVQLALGAGRTAATREVARRLSALCPDSDDIVRVVHLRGGVPRDDSWIGSPDQPTLISSTVDQVGSRLLFRGYGVSESMRPVHAGVLSRDTLYFLDEVHLATAFQETLRELVDRYAGWAEVQVGRPLQVVSMSATPDARPGPVPFQLDADDRAHPVLRRRLEAPRPAELHVVKTKKARDASAALQNRSTLAATAARLAREAAKDGARSIGIILNRVDTARRAAEELTEVDDAEVILLTGQMRPYDRLEIQQRLTQHSGASRERGPGDPLNFTVATSCIEAGADLDFDALVTEVASLDALRQRFGRLNRLGACDAPQAYIIAASDQVAEGAPADPVYGEALRNTWHYLEEVAEPTSPHPTLDLGLAAFPVPEDGRRGSLLPTRAEAPVLFPNYLDLWSETRPAPHPDPDVTLWLHGKGREPDRHLSLVFRGDLPRSRDCSPSAFEGLVEGLTRLPPVAEEAVSVPVHQLRKWIESSDCGTWLWTSDGPEPLTADDLRPGQTVLVSTAHGGLRLGSWNPSHQEPCEDVAEFAAAESRGTLLLRVDPRTLPKSIAGNAPRPAGGDDPELEEESRAECVAWLKGLAEVPELDSRWLTHVTQLLSVERHLRLTHRSDSEGGDTWLVEAWIPSRFERATTEDSVSVYSKVETLLETHLRDVEAWSAAFSARAGLVDELARDVAVAGLLHDIGKADLRFQALLQGGDPIAAASGVLLAKSRRTPTPSAQRRAAERSGWPQGMRHEMISLAIFDASAALQGWAHDMDLVRHLIASHHGWCRPWAPAQRDPEPRVIELTVGGVQLSASTGTIQEAFLLESPARFRRLCRKYGWHGLAYLEALLRLGDHRASARPESRPKEVSP